MKGMTKAAESCVGIDPLGRSMRAVEITRQGSDEVWRTVEVKRQSPDHALDPDDLSRLSQTLDRRGIDRTQLVATVATTLIDAETFKLAKDESSSRIASLSQQVRESGAFEPDHSEIAWWPFPKSFQVGEEEEILVLGCRHDRANRLLDEFDRCGVTVSALDIEADAIRRYAQRASDHTRESVLLMLANWDYLMFAAVCDNSVFFIRHSRESGLASLYGTIRTHLGLTDEMIDLFFDADLPLLSTPEVAGNSVIREVLGLKEEWTSKFVDEARAVLTYLDHQFPESAFDKVFLMGEVASDAEFITRLRKALQIAVEAPTLTVRSSTGSCECETTIKPEFALAAGLALYGAEEE